MSLRRFNRMKCSALSKNADCTTGTAPIPCPASMRSIRPASINYFGFREKTKENVLLAQHDLSVLLDWTIRRDSMRALNASELGLPAPPAGTVGLFTRSNDQTAATATLQQFLLESLARDNARTTQD